MRKALRVTGFVSIWLGGTLLLFGVYQVYGTARIAEQHQEDLSRRFEQALQAPSAGDEPVALPRARSGPPPIARMRIPRISLDEIVVDGTTMRELSYGPGRYRTSARIGERGVTSIAGHRTGYGSPFLHLDRLRAGDEIVLETLEGTFRYRVTDTVVVGPTDTRVLRGDPDSTAERRLVLTTCTPKYTSRLRLIVWADQVAEERRTA